MSGSQTFDTEKKNRNGSILRLRLAYGRRSKNLPPRKLFDTTVPKEQSKMSGNQTFLELFVVFRLTGCNIVPLVSTALLEN